MNKDGRLFKMAKKIIDPFRLALIYRSDFTRFRTSSYNLAKKQSLINIRAEVTYLYHAIEKGMLHKNLRLGYGKQKIKRLQELIGKYFDCVKTGSPIDHRVLTALSVLQAYVNIHKKYNYDVSWIEKFLCDYKEIINEEIGGIVKVQKKDLIDFRTVPFSELAINRHSIRDFSTKIVPINEIKRAVDIARYTPSVCNRQAWNVVIVRDISKIEKLMTIQGGINGMGHNLSTMLVVISDYGYFGNIHERNQSYVDGGLFSMSLIYALQSRQIANCALNANLKLRDEKIVRKILELEDSSNIIMFIALGYYNENISFPKSNRDTIDDIILFR